MRCAYSTLPLRRQSARPRRRHRIGDTTRREGSTRDLRCGRRFAPRIFQPPQHLSKEAAQGGESEACEFFDLPFAASHLPWRWRSSRQRRLSATSTPSWVPQWMDQAVSTAARKATVSTILKLRMRRCQSFGNSSRGQTFPLFPDPAANHAVEEFELPCHRLGPYGTTSVAFGPAATYFERIRTMANKPTGDNVRKGTVRKRTQVRTEVMGDPVFEHRSHLRPQANARGRPVMPSERLNANKVWRSRAARSHMEIIRCCFKPRWYA